MRFETLDIVKYSSKWQSYSPIALHQSNPQPFTVEELEQIIGPIGELLDPQLPLGFTDNQGGAYLRTAIAGLYPQLPAHHVATFAGAQEAIFCVSHSLLEAGDKVVAITPVFEPILHTALEIGCQIEQVSLLPENGWQLDMNALESAIQAGCKCLLLNFPHNPTGAMISKGTLLKIIDLCDTHGVWILSDEVFRGLEHDPGDRLPPVAEIYPRAISIGVLSKAFALPALRVGWVVCQQASLVERATDIKTHLSICNSLMDEKIATRVLPHHEEIWDRNRALIAENLESLEQLALHIQDQFQYIKPQAGCCCFMLLNSAVPAKVYASELVENKNLLVMPGDLFLTAMNGFRLGFGYRGHAQYFTALF